MKNINYSYKNATNYFKFLDIHYHKTLETFVKERKNSKFAYKERKILLVLGYLLIVLSPLAFLLDIKFNYLFCAIIILLGLSSLTGAEFSFIYYAFAYKSYLKKDESINSKIISDYYFSKKSDLQIIAGHKNKNMFEKIDSTMNQVTFKLKKSKENNKLTIKICRKKLIINNNVISNDDFEELANLQECISSYINSNNVKFD